MKKLLVYWVIGCVLIGFPIGRLMTKCPNDKIPPDAVIVSVAVWPAMLVAAIVSNKQESQCEINRHQPS